MCVVYHFLTGPVRKWFTMRRNYASLEPFAGPVGQVRRANLGVAKSWADDRAGDCDRYRASFGDRQARFGRMAELSDLITGETFAWSRKMARDLASVGRGFRRCGEVPAC